MKKFFRNNWLSILMLSLAVLFLWAQAFTGLKVYNEQNQENNSRQVWMIEYLKSPHFISSTFENRESEFLQMAAYVIFTIYFFQKGSAESKDPDWKNEVDDKPKKWKDAPAPVNSWGLALKIYQNSLTLALVWLFLISFGLHFYGSRRQYNLEQDQKHLEKETAGEYIKNSQFWFESFQNWQSEFLSVWAIVILTIYLRQIWSAESKKVDAPNSETWK